MANPSELSFPHPLEFDPDAHAYSVAGKPVPNVTSILQVAIDLRAIRPDVLDSARDRGHLVHLACHYDDTGELDDDAVPDHIRPYLLAYRKFKREMTPVVLQSEQVVFHRTQWYAGTFDKRVSFGRRLAIIDIKSGMVHPAVALQLAAYALAWRDMTHDAQPHERYALQLDSDTQDYDLKRYKNLDDAPVFLGLVGYARWRARHGC
jgi:hypothetical protein